MDNNIVTKPKKENVITCLALRSINEHNPIILESFVKGYINGWHKCEEVNNYEPLLSALKEIAVPYPEEMTEGQAEILCKYLIARAQEAINKTQNP